MPASVSASSSQRFPARAVRNLLYNLVRRDLTVRYKSTVLGFFWSFLKPLAMTAIFYLVFQRILNMQLRPGDEAIPMALHMLAGMLAWNFFAGAAAESMGVVLSNANLIKKVRLPLLVFPAATVISHLVHFALGLVVLVALLILNHLPPTAAYIWLIPLVGLHALLTFSIAMLLSSLNVFYRDVGSIWEVLTTAWFYATPIVYPVWMASRKLEGGGAIVRALYFCNPMTPIVVAYRDIFLYRSAGSGLPEMEGLIPALGLSLAISLILFALSLKIFRRYARSFADEL